MLNKIKLNVKNELSDRINVMVFWKPELFI